MCQLCFASKPICFMNQTKRSSSLRMCAPSTPNYVIVLLFLTTVLIPKYPPDLHQVIVLLLHTRVAIPQPPPGLQVTCVKL